ncbi:MAG: fibrobacter succinogenes major paralogous domain-containing protein [Bacteroidales bacterium]
MEKQLQKCIQLANLLLIIFLSISCKKETSQPKPVPATVTDIDGNVYHTIKIGTQTWMVENLKVTKYNDGTAIPLVTDSIIFVNLTTPCYCWVNNDQATYGNTYGALYNWHTVNTGKLSPIGWHVPTDSDWTTLTNFLGGEDIAGLKLKETGNTHWMSNPLTWSTNESGFTALPGGNRSSMFQGSGSLFYYIGHSGYWWSATDYDMSFAWCRIMRYYEFSVHRNYIGIQIGCSVRCVKD